MPSKLVKAESSGAFKKKFETFTWPLKFTENTPLAMDTNQAVREIDSTTRESRSSIEISKARQ